MLAHYYVSQSLRSGVKKYRSGRRRYYFTGHHVECRYLVQFILVNKKDAEDKPEQKQFQNKVLKAVADKDTVRMLLPPETETSEAEAEE